MSEVISCPFFSQGAEQLSMSAGDTSSVPSGSNPASEKRVVIEPAFRGEWRYFTEVPVDARWVIIVIGLIRSRHAMRRSTSYCWRGRT